MPEIVTFMNKEIKPLIFISSFSFFLLACPIWLPVFSLFSNEPELGTEIDSGMIMTAFPSIIMDETGFEPTTYRS